jgi:hypothetical protein
MNNLDFPQYDYNDYETDDETSYNESDDEQELQCKNIDPALAKLMGIIIEKQELSDWKPPSKSGLDNSNEILSSTYFKNQNIVNDIDFFTVIKDDILNYKTLTTHQLDYIKNLNNQEQFELIQIYNQILNETKQQFK